MKKKADLTINVVIVALCAFLILLVFSAFIFGKFTPVTEMSNGEPLRTNITEELDICMSNCDNLTNLTLVICQKECLINALARIE